jgi:hypothetical protein
MTFHLIFYHIWLMRQNITTFDHILYKRELTKRKDELRNGDLTMRGY